MTVIELGDLSSGERDAPAPVRVDRRMLRPIAVALVAVLCVLTVTGSARPAGPRVVRPLWSIPYGGAGLFTLTATSVYTMANPNALVLVAHSLGDGATRWTRVVPRPASWLELTEQAGVLLVPAKRVGKGDGGTYYDEFTTETAAVDPRTGAELWRHAGAVSLTGPDTVLFTEQDRSGRFLTRLSVVRLRDGSTVWTRPAPQVEFLASDGNDPEHPGWIVTGTPTGKIEVLRFADGVRVAGTDVPWPARQVVDAGLNGFQAKDGRLYVTQLTGTQAIATGYDVDTLRQLWRIDHLPPGITQVCGTTLCSFGPDGVTAYDGATGAERWRNAGFLATWAIGPGRILTAPQGNGNPQLLDAESGRQIADLGQGVPVLDNSGGRYLLRETRMPANRMSISRINVATGELTLRGTIDRVTDYGCAALDHLIACPTMDGRLAVTAVG